MKDLIPRVEILNQHLYNDPMIKMPCQKACKIKRGEDQELPHEISTAEWNGFCDEVDEALKPVDQAKRVARRSLIPSFVLVLIIASLTIGSMLLSYDFKYRPYVVYAVLGILGKQYIFNHFIHYTQSILTIKDPLFSSTSTDCVL